MPALPIAFADSGAPTWLRGARDRAARQFVSRGFPGKTEEDWRYTDLSPIGELLNTPVMATTADSDAGRLTGHADLGMTLAWVNGIYRADLSTGSVPAGVSCKVLSEANVDDRDEWLRTLQGEPPGGPSAAGLAELRTALTCDGLRLEVAAGVHVADPVHLLFIGPGGTSRHCPLYIRLGRGSSAVLIEHHVGTSHGLASCSVDVTCEPGSRLHFVRVQDTAEEAFSLGVQRFAVRRDARLELLHLDLGGRLARNDLQVRLEECGAQVTARGLFLADRRRHLDNHTRIDHVAPSTRSRETYRGIVDQGGRGVFNGKVIVHTGAHGADAQLRNQNLLLSNDAEVDTKPELEIYADDVKCAHGATTGQLDANAIFYLRSRGIPADQARGLLIASFAREMLTGLPGALAGRVLQSLGSRMPDLAEVGQPP